LSEAYKAAIPAQGRHPDLIRGPGSILLWTSKSGIKTAYWPRPWLALWAIGFADARCGIPAFAVRALLRW